MNTTPPTANLNPQPHDITAMHDAYGPDKHMHTCATCRSLCALATTPRHYLCLLHIELTDEVHYWNTNATACGKHQAPKK